VAAGGAQILVVDDDRLVSRVVGVMLRDLGEVTVGESGEAAEPMLAERDWDAILVDVELPGMGGLDFLEIARRARPETGIAVLSSHGEDAYAEVARRAGADDYVTKPIAPADLQEKVSVLIALTARRRG
jgi:DNA-binding response OmpR family regulator